MLSANLYHRLSLKTVIQICFGLIVLSACSGEAANEVPSRDLATPQYAVSTSLCGDAYLQYFAPETIKALSWQSRSTLSLATPAHKTLPQIRANAAYVLPHQDKLILFGAGEQATITADLPHTVDLNWTEDFAGVTANAEAILGSLQASKDKLIMWQTRLAALQERVDVKKPKPKILYFSRAGGSAGPSTFIDSVITVAGGDNINPVTGWHTPDLETLIQYKPDIILTSFSGGNYHSRSDLHHPVITRLKADKPVIDIHGSYWPCAGPALIEAAEELQDAIQNWQSTRDTSSESPRNVQEAEDEA